MSLIRRLITREPKHTPRKAVVEKVPRLFYDLPRDGHWAVRGESFRQDAIAALSRDGCTMHPTEGRPTCDVLLISEPTNREDPDVIMVKDTGGNLLGYMTRDDAPKFGPVMYALERRGYAGARCGAVITGGESGRSSYGVVLLLSFEDKCIADIHRARPIP